MAAPCGEFVRIRLYFENKSFERSWLLIVFKKLPFVSDVINEIRKRNDICRESRISLRLKDHVLPGIEASFILKEDDIVCVRVENSDSADNDIPIASNIEDTRERKKKRKRKHNESLEFVHDIIPPKELKQDKRVDESSTADKSDKTPKKKPMLEDFQELHDQNCIDVGIKAMGEKDIPMKKETPKASDDEANESEHSVKKRKRTRKRKRKSKKPALDESGNCHDGPAFGKDISHCYVGNEVKKEDLFYGKLPDKLENPKNYRKGYRNLKQYNALPNVHKTFDSDSEVEEENMEQYNFLSKANSGDAIKTADEQANWVEKNVISSFVTPNNNSNNTQNDSVHNISANTEPWHYTNMNSRALYDSVKKTPDQPENDNFTSQLTSPPESSISPAGPTILTKVTLTSGASVFKRVRTPVRSKPVSKVWEMSKDEQINTIATNHSTIFQNSPATFSTSLKAETITPTRKEPDGPVTNPAQSGYNGQSVGPGGIDLQGIPSGLSGVQDGLLNDLSDQVLSKLPPVVGMPDVGDKIAYKILEMSANCTPEVSEYKVGEVSRVDAGQMLEIHNITQQTDVVPNKFHVEMEYEDEILTNSAQPPDVAYLHLSSLLDPRLVHKAEQA
ncbi:uncharacterized protein LOC128225205 isoform X2 [Mya arenaria]|uniref:uncharacterized protein LOC128225205 isoform X2 n=1 Tax=Mya arenaria TaxID=6604 RepID=UPI0022E0B52F|nr:uncharacterized protein LOC128225205 isoform X2 [Mya arenaria]